MNQQRSRGIGGDEVSREEGKRKEYVKPAIVEIQQGSRTEGKFHTAPTEYGTLAAPS
jgi:hypothetical protein